jgi:hypothetical protein
MNASIVEIWHAVNETLRILVWPLLLTVLFFVAHKQLFSLLQRVKGLRYDKFELDLQAKTVAASTEISVIEAEHQMPLAFDWDERRKAAVANPAQTVLISWKELETAIERFFRQRAGRAWPGTLRAVSEMSQAGEITREEASSFSKLYELKNLLTYEIGSVDNPTSYVLEFLRMTSILKSSFQERITN